MFLTSSIKLDCPDSKLNDTWTTDNMVKIRIPTQIRKGRGVGGEGGRGERKRGYDVSCSSILSEKWDTNDIPKLIITPLTYILKDVIIFIQCYIMSFDDSNIQQQTTVSISQLCPHKYIFTTHIQQPQELVEIGMWFNYAKAWQCKGWPA